MNNYDYNHLQITAVQRETEKTVLPMLRERFPKIVEDLSVALTGSSSFGACDRFSDCDATLFILEDDNSSWNEPISRRYQD